MATPLYTVLHSILYWNLLSVDSTSCEPALPDSDVNMAGPVTPVISSTVKLVMQAGSPSISRMFIYFDI